MRTWFRWYEGTTEDPKFRWVASKSGQPLPVVISIWAKVLERASESTERGRIEGFDCETIDVFYGLADGVTASIMDLFQSKGMIGDDAVANWGKRQGASKASSGASKSSTERSREFRQRKKEQAASATQCNADATGCNADATDATGCNASATQCNGHATDATECNGHATPREDKRREEENRGEKDTETDATSATQCNADATGCNASATQCNEEGADAPVSVSVSLSGENETGSPHPTTQQDDVAASKPQPEAKKPKLTFGEYGNVLLTQDEYNKLVAEYGEEFTKQKIQDLDLYIGSKGRHYKSHYMTILTWIKKDFENGKPTKMQQQTLFSQGQRYVAKPGEFDLDRARQNCAQVMEELRDEGFFNRTSNSTQDGCASNFGA